MTGRLFLDVTEPISHVRLVLEILPPESETLGSEPSAASLIAAHPTATPAPCGGWFFETFADWASCG